jgi:hypothetical protein
MVMEWPFRLYIHITKPIGYANCYRHLFFNSKHYRFRLCPIRNLYHKRNG